MGVSVPGGGRRHFRLARLTCKVNGQHGRRPMRGLCEPMGTVERGGSVTKDTLARTTRVAAAMAAACRRRSRCTLKNANSALPSKLFCLCQHLKQCSPLGEQERRAIVPQKIRGWVNNTKQLLIVRRTDQSAHYTLKRGYAISPGDVHPKVILRTSTPTKYHQLTPIPPNETVKAPRQARRGGDDMSIISHHHPPSTVVALTPPIAARTKTQKRDESSYSRATAAAAWLSYNNSDRLRGTRLCIPWYSLKSVAVGSLMVHWLDAFTSKIMPHRGVCGGINAERRHK